MRIRLNGDEKLITSSKKNIPLYELLKILGYEKNTIVIELNNLIINSEEGEDRFIKEGDKLEIVSIVGGG